MANEILREQLQKMLQMLRGADLTPERGEVEKFLYDMGTKLARQNGEMDLIGEWVNIEDSDITVIVTHITWEGVVGESYHTNKEGHRVAMQYKTDIDTFLALYEKREDSLIGYWVNRKDPNVKIHVRKETETHVFGVRLERDESEGRISTEDYERDIKSFIVIYERVKRNG